MLLPYAPAVVAALMVLLSPGLLWAWWRYPAPEPITRLCVGVCVGFAYQVHTAALLAATLAWGGPGITTASVALATAVGVSLAALLVWSTPAPAFWPQLHQRYQPHQHRAPRTEALQLCGVLAVVGIPRLLPLVVEQLPAGWDPSFHSLLASTTLASHRLPSWAPFEPIPSNYPYGPHLLLAQLSLLTGVAPDRAFSVLLNGVLPTLSGLVLYALGRRVLRTHALALGVVAAYGLLGNWGSIEYLQWGGVPNALGFVVLLTFVLVLFAPLPPAPFAPLVRASPPAPLAPAAPADPAGSAPLAPRALAGSAAPVASVAASQEVTRVVVGGVVLGAVALSHHHVLLTAVLLLSVYAAYLFARWRGWLSRTGEDAVAGGSLAERATERRQSGRLLVRLLLMAGIALVSVSYYVVPLALRAGSLGSTNVAQYGDEFSGLPFEKNGWLLWGLAVVGGTLMLGAVRARRQGVSKLRAPYAASGTPGLARAFVICASATLAAAFVLFFFGYREYSLYLSAAHQPYTLFTPSRFLTDLTYFLAFFAAIPLTGLWQSGGRWSIAQLQHLGLGPGRGSQMLSGVSRPVVRTAIAVVVLATAILTLDIPAILANGHLEAGEAQAFAWIRANTSSNTLVVNLNPSARWTPYFAQREVSYTPVPISEFTEGYVNEKRALSDELVHLVTAASQPRVLEFAGVGDALTALASRPVVVLTDQLLHEPGATLAYIAGPERVYRLGAAFASLGMPPASSGHARIEWWHSLSGAPPGGWNTPTSGESAGWSTTAPTHVSTRAGRADVYLRLWVAGPLPPGAVLACSAQRAATAYIDGTKLSAPCSSQLESVPRLSAPGTHMVALHAVFTSSMDPWLNMLLAAPGGAAS